MARHEPAPRRVLVLGIILAAALASPAPWARAGATVGSIRQIVEAGQQGRSCPGVVIELGALAFNQRIESKDIEIRDGKHDADLRSAVDWKVSTDGKRLTIRLKQQSSDFGSGNALRVCVERAAFRQRHQPSNERECWMIGTDPL